MTCPRCGKHNVATPEESLTPGKPRLVCVGCGALERYERRAVPQGIFPRKWWSDVEVPQYTQTRHGHND